MGHECRSPSTQVCSTGGSSLDLGPVMADCELGQASQPSVSLGFPMRLAPDMRISVTLLSLVTVRKATQDITRCLVGSVFRGRCLYHHPALGSEPITVVRAMASDGQRSSESSCPWKLASTAGVLAPVCSELPCLASPSCSSLWPPLPSLAFKSALLKFSGEFRAF